MAGFVNARGGTLWIWLDPHGGLGGPALIYLNAATERPGSTRATSRIRSVARIASLARKAVPTESAADAF